MDRADRGTIPVSPDSLRIFYVLHRSLIYVRPTEGLLTLSCKNRLYHNLYFSTDYSCFGSLDPTPASGIVVERSLCAIELAADCPLQYPFDCHCLSRLVQKALGVSSN